MKYLTPTSEQQTLQVIPRVYTTGVSISLRDDTSDEIAVKHTISFNFVTEFLEILFNRDVLITLNSLIKRSKYYSVIVQAMCKYK